MGAGRVLAALGGLVAVAIAAGVWLVAAEDPDGREPAETTAATPAPAGAPKADGPGPKKATRRKAKAAGTASIGGVVRRRQGAAPAAGQVVTLSEEGGEGWTAECDASGSFAFAALPEGGPYELTVSAPGFATVRVPGLALTKGEQRDVGTLWLDQAVRLTVLVTAWGAEPIEGASVQAYVAPDWQRGGSSDWNKWRAQLLQAPVAVATATTGKDGRAVFPELASGMWTFTAQKAGYARDGRANLRLEGGVEPPEVRIHLPAGYAVRGRVLDGDERPLPGVLVVAARGANVYDLGGAPLRARATSDEQGRYELTSLAAGDVVLQVAPKGAGLFVAATVRVPNVAEYDLHVRSGGTLQGAVTETGTGAPVEGATVRVYGSNRQMEVTTDAAGKYVVPAVPDGPIGGVTVEKDGWVHDRSDEPPGRQMQVNAGETATRDVRMRRAAKVRGVVRAEGAPVAGARVLLQSVSAEQQQPQRWATTDAEGRYEVNSVDRGRGMVVVQKEGWVQPGMPENVWMVMQQGSFPAQYRVEIGPETTEVQLDVELVRGARIEGRVESPEGPVEGATVNLYSQIGGIAATARTAADGTFAVEGATPGSKPTLYAMKEGFVSGKNDPVTVLQDQPTTGVVLKLLKQKTVRGKVSSAGGATLRDAQVTVVRAPGRGRGEETWSPDMQWGAGAGSPVAQDGTFEAKVPWAEGAVLVRATALDHAPADSPVVQLAETQQEYEANVVLESGYALRGRVSAKGAALAGADVSLVASGRPQVEAMYWNPGMNQGQTVVAVTGADGVFEVGHVAAGSYSVAAAKEGYVRKQQGDVKVPGGDVNLEVEPALEITGVVAFADGTPAPGAYVSAQSDQPQAAGGAAGSTAVRFADGMAVPGSRRGGGGPGATAVADANGRFRLRGLASGNYRLTVTSPGDASVNFRSRTTDPVAAGASRVEIAVAAGGTIAGRVVAPDKTGVAGVRLHANPTRPGPGEAGASARTKEDGTFTLSGLGDGPYTLSAQAPQYSPAGVFLPTQLPNVAVGTKDLEVVLDAGLAIEGAIVDPAGKPLADAMLYAQFKPEQGKGMPANVNWQNMQASSGADGRFRFQGLTPGKYHLMLNAWPGSKHESLCLTGGEEVAAGASDVRLVASTGARLAGVVVDEAGQGLAGVNVFASPASGAGGRSARSDKDGRFELTGLPPGALTLHANVGGRPPASVENVEAGTSGVRIVLVKGEKLGGRLLDARGAPVARTHLQFKASDPGRNHNGSATTGEDGRFLVENLPEGMYEVTAWRAKTEGSNQWEQVPLGKARTGSTDVELRLP